MLQNILVPLDGSATGEAALPYAIGLAQRSGAKLTLIRAARAGARLFAEDDDQAVAIGAAERYLEAVATRVAAQGVAVDTGVPYGPTAEWIGAETELRSVDFVVMATHDRIGPQRWVQGSVAESVVHHASVPVLLVRAAPDTSEWNPPSEPVLVVPLDGSTFAEAALPIARALAVLLSARAVLVGVCAPSDSAIPSDGGVFVHTKDDDLRRQYDMRAYLNSVLRKLPLIEAETVVRVGDAATEIAREVEERSAGAVIMATHGRTGLVRTILGSVAGGVVHRTTAPVVLVRPGHVRSEVDPALAAPRDLYARRQE